MSEKEDLTTAAKKFVERFGNKAPDEARRRATEMRLFGKANGYYTWMKIFDEVKGIIGKGAGKTRH